MSGRSSAAASRRGPGRVAGPTQERPTPLHRLFVYRAERIRAQNSALDSGAFRPTVGRSDLSSSQRRDLHRHDPTYVRHRITTNSPPMLSDLKKTGTACQHVDDWYGAENERRQRRHQQELSRTWVNVNRSVHAPNCNNSQCWNMYQRESQRIGQAAAERPGFGVQGRGSGGRGRKQAVHVGAHYEGKQAKILTGRQAAGFSYSTGRAQPRSRSSAHLHHQASRRGESRGASTGLNVIGHNVPVVIHNTRTSLYHMMPAQSTLQPMAQHASSSA